MECSSMSYAPFLFYIHTSRCQSLYETMTRMTDWKKVKINYENIKETSIPFTSSLKEDNYPLLTEKGGGMTGPCKNERKREEIND